jgi:histidinol-phosphatase (PHP family)
MLPDYHIHSDHSFDAHDPMVVVCRTALELGVDEIGFSEHLDLHPLDRAVSCFDPGKYWDALVQCREAFHSQLVIRAALEVGEPHHYASELEAILASYSWDYVLGSQHWLGDMSVFDPAYFEQSPDEAYRHFFNEELELVQLGDFDILAHMDIAKRYGYEAYGAFDPHRWEEPIRAVLRELARRDRALEVNSGTLRRSVNETSPGTIILQWFREEGGRLVTFGSDAHYAEHVGFARTEVARQLQAAGFFEFARFEKRQAQLQPLNVDEG